MSCETETKYLKNRYMVSIQSIKPYQYIGKDEFGCSKFYEIRSLEALKEIDTVFLGILFKKEYFSDSTAVLPYRSAIGMGKDGLLNDMESIVVLTKNGSSKAINISKVLDNSNIDLLSFENTFFKGDSLFFSRGNCVETEKFGSINHLVKEFNRNSKRVYSETLIHEVFFKIPSSVVNSIDFQGRINYY